MASIAYRHDDTSGNSGDLEKIVEDAAHLLPAQPPLHLFVHHNTLHPFEHLHFDDAIAQASLLFGSEGYQSEAAFARHLESGRILDSDVRAVLEVDRSDGDARLYEGGPTLQAFKHLRLRHLFEVPTGAALEWCLREEGAGSRLRPDLSPERRRQILAGGLEEVELGRLWEVLEQVSMARVDPVVVSSRWRDRLHAVWGIDPDDWVHPFLIRVSAAFLDQGIAYWPMPDRELGFLRAVRRLYGQKGGPPWPWASGLRAAFARQEREQWSAEETIAWALDEGEVAEADRPEVIRSTLLSLRGWAGMMHQLEVHPERAPVQAPPASLMDYLAVQICCDLFAAKSVLHQRLGQSAKFSDLPGEDAVRASAVDRSRIYEAFVLAQYSEISFSDFRRPEVARAWLAAIEAFDEIERRRLMHLAYERHHRVELLDALAIGPAQTRPVPARFDFQAVFCIDDREESLRRHLEQLEPGVETLGYAGFFGVAMDYQGLEDVRSRPLCPVVISPSHHVREVPDLVDENREYAQNRRRRARARHASSVAARTLVRGGLASSLLGSLSILPLVGHALFPRLAHRLSEWWGGLGLERPRTRLAFEAEPEGDMEQTLRAGYTISEMAMVVESALRTMGLDPTRSDLILIVGHGSSSLNNPHEAAHDCGATGGGRGGPNARAFAAMGNHASVRKLLSARGFEIPDSTWFVGAYHNTCDDSMTYYDTHSIPDSNVARFEAAQRSLEEACLRDAHERCRRFETAPVSIGLERALEDVQEHSVDLAQPRPEYGHATNAVCIVGRRSRTRDLFLDRRAFLVSYDPETDPDGALLAPLLLSAGPVGAGINLEYYFSFVDPQRYGSGTKLPHNITGLLGVMNGHATDLRTGLPWQMVEIHEPVRMLTVVDARRSVLEGILAQHEPLRNLIEGEWIQFVCWDPDDDSLWVFENGSLRPYRPASAGRRVEGDSMAYYSGKRDHLAPAWLGSKEAAR